MTNYYGPGDCLATIIDGRAIGSLLATLEVKSGTPTVEVEGIGETWGRSVPIGVRKAEFTQDGWFTNEIREMFLGDRDLRTSQLLVFPSHMDGEALLFQGECKASVDISTPQGDSLIGGTITYATRGELFDDLIPTGYIELVTPNDIRADRDPVAGSFTTLSSATLGAQTTAGARIYATADRIVYAPHYDALRVHLANQADRAGTFNQFLDIGAAADSADAQTLRGLTGQDDIASGTAIPADLFLSLLFQPAFTMEVGAAASMGDSQLTLARTVAGSPVFEANDRFTLAGDPTVYEVQSRTGLVYTIAPVLAADVVANVVATPDSTGNRAEFVAVALRRF